MRCTWPYCANCPQRDGYWNRDAVVDVPGPTLAEAAGRAVSAADAAAAAPSETASLHADTDSLDGVSVTSAVGVSTAGSGLDSQLDAAIN